MLWELVTFELPRRGFINLPPELVGTPDCPEVGRAVLRSANAAQRRPPRAAAAVWGLAGLLGAQAGPGRRRPCAPCDPPPLLPQELAALIQDCMDVDPAKRPTAKQVLERLLACPGGPA